MKRYGKKYEINGTKITISAYDDDEYGTGLNIALSYSNKYYPNLQIDLDEETFRDLVRKLELKEVDNRALWLPAIELEYKDRSDYSVFVGGKYVFRAGAQDPQDIVDSIMNQKIEYEIIRTKKEHPSANIFDGLIKDVTTVMDEPIDDFLMRHTGIATLTIDVPVAISRYSFTDPVERESILRRQIKEQLDNISNKGEVIPPDKLDHRYDRTANG